MGPVPENSTRWSSRRSGTSPEGSPSDGSKDVFVHVSAVERSGLGTLREGEKVSYDVVNERGKPAAGNLQRA